MSVPVYIHIEKQEQVLTTIDKLKQQLLDAKKILHELYDLRAEENKHLHEAKQRIAQTNERIALVEEVFGGN